MDIGDKGGQQCLVFKGPHMKAKKAAPFQNKTLTGMGRLENDMDINRF